MSLKTYSVFYYGHTVTPDNQYIDFAESSILRRATIPVGSYTLSKLLEVVAVQMTQAGANSYSTALNRTTRIVTLNSDNPFDLLGTSGPNGSQSLLPLLGLPIADQIATTSVAGTSPSGFEFIPQYTLQNHVSTANSKKSASAVVNKSASGKVSVQSFGEESFLEGDIQYSTNIEQPSRGPIRNNPTGEDDLRAFMDYAKTKAPIEYMANIGDRDDFEKLLLESTPDQSDGTGYKLRERYDKGLPGYFDTGVLKFRTITED